MPTLNSHTHCQAPQANAKTKRSALLRNIVLNGQESGSNPLLHIHANRWGRMKQANLIKIYMIVGTAMLFGCRETEFNYNCGLGASTPTDLRITNNTTREVEVTLKVKENQLMSSSN